jgi:hypothetical protein
MSRASSSRRGVYVEGPKNDIFTALLGVALGAIILACVFLLLEFWLGYDFKTNPTGMVPSRSAPAVAWQSTPAEAPGLTTTGFRAERV